MEAETIPCERAGRGGSLFLQETNALSRPTREAAIYDAVIGGAVPSFARVYVDVPLVHAEHRAVVRAAVDYVAIGTDEDFVRMPMTPITAQRLADQLGLALPTKKLVDAIYAAAVVKLAPSPLPPGPQMMSNDYYRRHHEAIEKRA